MNDLLKLVKVQDLFTSKSPSATEEAKKLDCFTHDHKNSLRLEFFPVIALKELIIVAAP